MYTERNFKTKKQLKEAVAMGSRVTIYQPNDIFNNPASAPDYTGKAFVEGPHYPQAHTWYAEVTMQDGVIVKVK
jgi:hypothetical protein